MRGGPRGIGRRPDARRRCNAVRVNGELCAEWTASDSDFCATHRGPPINPGPPQVTPGEFFYVVEMPDGGWSLTARGVRCGESRSPEAPHDW